MGGRGTALVQPEGSKSLSKGLTRVANREWEGRRGRGGGLGIIVALPLTFGDSLTSRLEDGLEGLPSFGGMELESVGEVVFTRHAAEQGFFVLGMR